MEEKGGGWVQRVKLSRRFYQVKPPTTDCRHGDTVVTSRCSGEEKERDLGFTDSKECSSAFLRSFRSPALVS